ncbi:sigma-70 family RNA polymerase sigma factor [Sulfitobacter sp. TSTF-M16]|uniref:Sigma-70 family RNA polymerase sigma factor n=1 Tax=Sulfitobacter aestuariivivens TaxID=2766981 RepID=A0A927HE31_9RHOB|nr:sigma-70 family RNA polymerase sigma factor [Sulfitobacter aestuariivivens]MBD3663461.1 sigma-70 family RNA polymerase sigma factor [Sulfitobacter aestuariivivens]
MTETVFMPTLLPRLQRRARRLCRTRDDAEDLAQEAALRLLQRLAKNNDVDRPEHYAMILLHNLARQNWRQRQETEELADDMAQTAPAAPGRIACAELRAAIAGLPCEQADLMARLLEGESSPRAIAQQTGLPLGTVMSRLARARARLRKELDVEGSVEELL